MKSLCDFKDEINKCSKCGLCQSVCPVFKETGNECAVSKGKFVMLDGVLKGDLKLNKNINKYLDMCLKCGKCKDFCPSGIDVCRIFETAKYEYVKNSFWGKFVFFLESKFVKAAKQLGSAAKNLEDLRTGGQEGKLFNKSYLSEIMQTQQNKNGLSPYRPIALSPSDKNPSTKLKLLYFPGCVGNIFPKTREILKKIPDIEVIERDFDCCGMPFLSSGNLKRYEEVKKHNLELMDCEFDYILTDCASCESTLKYYFNRTQSAPTLPSPIGEDNNTSSFPSGEGVQRTEGGFLETSCPTINFLSLGELIVKQNIKFKSEKPVKVTFHKPCHMKNIDFIKPLFQNCENVEYVEMEGFDDCCGFAGEFALKNHKISKSISDKKAQNIINTGADYVITCCPSCILGLKQGLFGKKNAPKAMNLSEFLIKLF